MRERRILRGLSPENLAEQLGTTGIVIKRLEHGGDQKHLTLGFVNDLARRLGIRVADLFTEDAVPEPDDAEASDPAVVGRHLAAAGSVHVDTLARALNWTNGRVRYAGLQLESLLDDCGQALAWNADTDVHLVPSAGSGATVAAVSSQDPRARGIRSTTPGCCIASPAAFRTAGPTTRTQWRSVG